MPKQTKETRKPKEPMYSYDEYQRTFYPKPPLEREVQEPEVFGARLAEAALKKIAEQQSE